MTAKQYPLSKACTKCRQVKPMEGFAARAASSDGRTSQCLECRRAAKRSWAAQNPEKVAEYNREWSEKNPEYHRDWRGENAEAIRERHRQIYAENPQKHAEKRKRMYEKHREKRLEYSAQYKRDNPAQNAMHAGAYKARKRQATPSWADRPAMLRVYQLARFATEESGLIYTVDHIVPLVSDLVCGLHCEQNLQVMSLSENASKNNRYDPVAGPVENGAKLCFGR